MDQAPDEDVQYEPAGPPYHYDSRQGYAEAYGYDSPEAYEKARASYDDSGTGHHPGLCSSRCPSCKEPQHRGGLELERGAG
jgi:hypothetical protein